MSAVAATTPCYCTMLRKSARALTAVYDAALEPAGIRATQHSLLRNLQRCGPASLQQLGALLNLDRTTLVRNLKILETRKLVRFAPSGSKARLAALTPEGEELLARAEPLWLAAQTAIHNGFSDPERETLRSLLQRLAAIGADSDSK
jgi:DNA-binding MarR family transcriptional regulator